jgi:protein CWC15
MSTAHRPTWTPKVGGGGLKDGVKSAPTFRTSSRDQNAHTKLKIRKPEQLVSPKNKQTPVADQLLLTDNKNFLKALEDSPVSEEEEDNDMVDEEENSEEDEELLRLEIEKIRKERQETKRRQTQEKKIKEQIELADKCNPLNDPVTFSSPEEGNNLQTTPKWTDDSVFRVDYRTGKGPEKRFINDTTKSDFHRRFMDKYFK